MLFRSLALIAPKPARDVKAQMPFIVAGVLRTASGLGQSARLSHDAIKAAGLPVYGIDLTAALMQAEDHPEFTFEDGRALEGPGTLIVHVNAPLMPLAMACLGRHLIRNKRVIGYWHWELPSIPADWRHGIPFVHEIWAPSRFTAEAVKPIAAGRPVRVVPHPVALHQARTRPATGAIDRPFTVVTIFNMASSFARKNPLAAISAFSNAFGSDPATRLVVKTSNLSAFPSGINSIKDAAQAAYNIVVIDWAMSAADIDGLYYESDVVMSLHRSEGFGLTIAEAMVRGLPVVATNWSGNVDFLTEESGIPIAYRLVPAEDPQGTYHHPNMSWAEADVEEAAAALRRLRDDRALGLTLGRAAAQFAARTWSAEAYAAAVRQHLGL